MNETTLKHLLRASNVENTYTLSQPAENGSTSASAVKLQ